MPRHLIRSSLFMVLAGILLSGCTATKDIAVRSYKQDKKRVDQIVEGTVGNWENAPQAVANQTKDTRKVYFVEFTKESGSIPDLDHLDSAADMDNLDREPKQKSTKKRSSNNFAKNRNEKEATQKRIVRKTTPRLDIPSFDEPYDETDVYETDQRYVDYKVKKGETLQKISKKFYNSYSKWPRIYEANKGVLKSPDVVSPGVQLKIPVE